MSELATICLRDRPALELHRATPANRGAETDRRGNRLSQAAPPWGPEIALLGSVTTSDAPVIADDATPNPAAASVLLITSARTATTHSLRRSLPAAAHRVSVCDPEDISVMSGTVEAAEVVVIELRQDEGPELDVCEQVRRSNPHVPVVVVARNRRPGITIEAMKWGAFDVLFDPLRPDEVRRVVGQAIEIGRNSRRSTVEEAGANLHTDDALVGSSVGMQEVYKAIGRVAGQDMPVLITGESGTGKELVARAIWQHSKRADKPFLALNCAAIPENLLESELFGHEKGAFTGADRRRIGKFEQCNGGTIFLDEIGDMPPALQGKVLRLLQEQAFERVGGNETVRTDVRVIAATHRDLRAWAAEGRFRPDLYYRLGVFTVDLPPLRERGDDLPLLVGHFVRLFSRELGRAVRDAAPATLERLRAYPWPGNVRELQSVLKQALLRATGSVLLPAFLPNHFDDAGPSDESSGRVPGLEEFVRQRLRPGCHDLDSEVHGGVDRVLLPLVMEYMHGNQSQAAHVLGIARQTLRRRLREAGLADARAAFDTDDAAE